MALKSEKKKEGCNNLGSNISGLLGECEMRVGVYQRIYLNWILWSTAKHEIENDWMVNSSEKLGKK